MERFQNTGQPDWDWWGKLWPTPGETLRSLGISPETTLAEVPCGSGYFALPAAKITAPNPVYALDIDESLLDELSELAELQDIENIVPIHGDARELSTHLSDPVDAVLIANTLHGVSQRGDFLQQAFNSLRPGGTLIIINWDDRPQETTTIGGEPRGPPTELRMSPAETQSAVLDAAEFTLDDHVDLPPYHYGLRFQR